MQNWQVTLCSLASAGMIGQSVDMTLESHGSALQHVRQAAIKQLIDAFGVDVAFGVDAQYVLGKVLGRVAPDFLAAVLAIKARVMAGAVQRLVGGIVSERKPFVRADRREADDVALEARLRPGRPCRASGARRAHSSSG